MGVRGRRPDRAERQGEEWQEDRGAQLRRPRGRPLVGRGKRRAARASRTADEKERVGRQLEAVSREQRDEDDDRVSVHGLPGAVSQRAGVGELRFGGSGELIGRLAASKVAPLTLQRSSTASSAITWRTFCAKRPTGPTEADCPGSSSARSA